MRRGSFIACGAILLLASSVHGQTLTQSTLGPPPQYPKVEISAGVVGMSRGPGEGGERALTSMGFHRSYGDIPMTQWRPDGFLKVDIGVSNHRTVGILTTRGVNETSGLRDERGKSMETISVRHVIKTRAVMWSYRPNGWLSVGAGPALYNRRFVIRQPDGSAVGTRSDRALGAVAAISAKTRRRDGVFMHALLQYGYAGSMTTDSVPTSLGQRRDPVRETVTWPSTRIPFSHRLIGVGIGVEF